MVEQLDKHCNLLMMPKCAPAIAAQDSLLAIEGECGKGISPLLLKVEI